MKTWEEKLEYFDQVIRPQLAEALQRGDRRYTGSAHFSSDVHMGRSDESDIRHVHECHVGVRLREAEDLATYSTDKTSILAKIVSAIGYLIILHFRVRCR